MNAEVSCKALSLARSNNDSDFESWATAPVKNVSDDVENHNFKQSFMLPVSRANKPRGSHPENMTSCQHVRKDS